MLKKGLLISAKMNAGVVIEERTFYVLETFESKVLLADRRGDIWVINNDENESIEVSKIFGDFSKLKHYENNDIYAQVNLNEAGLNGSIMAIIRNMSSIENSGLFSEFISYGLGHGSKIKARSQAKLAIRRLCFEIHQPPGLGDIIKVDYKGEEIKTGSVISYTTSINDDDVMYTIDIDGTQVVEYGGRIYEVVLSKKEMEKIEYKDGVFIQSRVTGKRYYGIYVEKEDSFKLTKRDHAKEMSFLVRDGDTKKILKFNYANASIKKNYKAYLRYCTFKVKSSDASAEIFGLAKLKKRIIGEEIHVIELLNNFKCKKDNKERDVLIVRTQGGREVKFLKEDIEIVYPDLNYKPKLDRKIKVDKYVVCIKPATIRLKKGNYYIVRDIVNNTSNKGLSILTLQDENGRVFKSRQRNFKVNEECVRRTEQMNKEQLVPVEKKSQDTAANNLEFDDILAF